LTYLNEDALAGLKIGSRERKLSTAERIAIYAFAQKGVPVKVIARTFGVKTTAIYYITNWEHTAAHENAKNAFEQMGADRVWNEIVTPAQIESINQGMEALMQGKKLNDRGYRRINRSSPGARRARGAHGLPEAANNDADGSDRAN
jgi:hypothetical protein